MARLIDAHDLWSDVMMLPHNGDMISSEEVEQAINDAPTVIPEIKITSCCIENKIPTVKMLADDGREVVIRGYPVDFVEVVHGRWEEVTDQDEIVGEMDFYKCSVCGKLRWFETNYCPNCGAKMDGDGNG